MKLRDKQTGALLEGDTFNTHALFEVFAGNDDGYDSYFGRDLDVWLEAKQEWKGLSQAMRDNDVISNKRNTRFGEPKTDADRERGYFL